MIRLKELREERGLNKTEAADFLGKKYTTYINHEKGYREPNSEDLKKSCSECDVGFVLSYEKGI